MTTEELKKWINPYDCYTEKEYREMRDRVLEEELNKKEPYKGKLCY